MRAIKGEAFGRFPHESPFEKCIVGVDDAEGPPVPIPNTEVKLCGAEDSALATRCENREMPTSAFCKTKYSSIAQSVVLQSLSTSEWNFTEMLGFQVFMW